MSSTEGGLTEPQVDELFAGLQLQPDVAQKPELPPEIIEAIVDEVAVQWRPGETLETCLKVARAFAYPAQKHLFKSIDLTAPAGRSGRRKAQKFWYHLLQSSPHIGVHVRKLAVGGDTAFRCYLPEKCERSTWTTCTWMSCAAINAVSLLPRILPLLSNLRYLDFSCRREEPWSWVEISEASRSALEQLFRAGSLQTVKFSFITNLTSQAFAQLFYIPNLVLSNVSLYEQGVKDRIYIQELSIGSDTAYQRYRPGKCERPSWTNCTWLMGATPNAAILPPQIFPLLVNLRSLDLSFGYRTGSWLDIPEAGQSALERLFQSRSLHTVNLSFITNLTSQAFSRLFDVPNLVLFRVSVYERAIYIRELEIRSDTTHQPSVSGKCERPSWTTCTWNMSTTPNTALPRQIFPQFINLRYLTLSFNESEPRRWPEIPEADKLALEQLFWTGSLQTVELKNITGFTSRALARLLNIPNLTLCKVIMAKEIGEGHIPIMRYTAGQLKLQTLTFSEFSLSTTRALARVIAASPSSMESFSKLSILAFYSGSGFIAVLEAVIKAAGNIRQFEWPSRIYVRKTMAPVVFDMHLFPHISTLRVSMGFSDNSFLCEVLHCLGQISDRQASSSSEGNNGGIKKLILICYDYHYITEPRRHMERWNNLDNMLSRPGLASLREITIEAAVHWKFSPSLLDVVLPATCKRDIRVSVSYLQEPSYQNQVTQSHPHFLALRPKCETYVIPQ